MVVFPAPVSPVIRYSPRSLNFEGDEATELIGVKTAVDGYTESMLSAFITGTLDPYDDAEWEAYINQYQTLGIGALIDAAQDSYAALLQGEKG